jgi:vancomycin resistance protein YoaR
LQGRSLSQRHNALLALRGIDQKVLPPNATFSFNSAVGSYSRDQGYRKAPVSYNGQLIDDWGGGVCQTSTTLYNAALLAGLTILERNHHRFCPSYVTPGRDAAVAYPSLDLRFQNPYPFPVRIHAQIERDMLQVELLASRPLPEPVSLNTRLSQRTRPATFVTGRAAGTHFLRNSGKAGYDTCVYRTVGKHEELISVDSYPVMNRLVEYR